MDNLTRAVPKPIKDTTPAEDEAVFNVRGGHGAIKAAVNALRQVGIVSTEPYRNRGDGAVDQKIYFTAYQTARLYEPQPERPLVERPGYVYLLRGMESGRMKVGETDNITRRKGELLREFGEHFKVIHLIHTRDRISKEQEMHQHLKGLGLHVSREFFNIPEQVEQWFIAQPNE